MPKTTAAKPPPRATTPQEAGRRTVVKKTAKTARISFRIDQAAYDAGLTAAEDEDRDVTGVARRAYLGYLREKGYLP